MTGSTFRAARDESVPSRERQVAHAPMLDCQHTLRTERFTSACRVTGRQGW